MQTPLVPPLAGMTPLGIKPKKPYKLFCYCCRAKLERDTYTSCAYCDACNVPGHTHEPVCNCWVSTKTEQERYSIRYGAHSTACNVYRESGDALDRERDEALRDANELHVTDADAEDHAAAGRILRIY